MENLITCPEQRARCFSEIYFPESLNEFLPSGTRDHKPPLLFGGVVELTMGQEGVACSPCHQMAAAWWPHVLQPASWSSS